MEQDIVDGLFAVPKDDSFDEFALDFGQRDSSPYPTNHDLSHVELNFDSSPPSVSPFPSNQGYDAFDDLNLNYSEPSLTVPPASTTTSLGSTPDARSARSSMSDYYSETSAITASPAPIKKRSTKKSGGKIAKKAARGRGRPKKSDNEGDIKAVNKRLYARAYREKHVQDTHHVFECAVDLYEALLELGVDVKGKFKKHAKVISKLAEHHSAVKPMTKKVGRARK